MAAIVLFLALLTLPALASPVGALTVEEIIALKKAGISEKTIQMLLEREREESRAAERSGAWATPETASPGCRQDYPLHIYPWINLPPPRESR